MKKRLILFLCLLACGGGMVWYFWPEYGTGYSEDQRRLWNERLELYPVAWRMCVNPSYNDLQAMAPDKNLSWLYMNWVLYDRSGIFLSELIDVMEEKGDRGERLRGKLFENRDFTGKEYVVKTPLRVDVSRLPLEGLTEKETADRALSGDGDACLQMVRYLCRNANGEIYELSWRERKEINKWLDKAMTWKRPGALFLKCFFLEECRSEAINEFGEWEARAGQRLGYGEYLACLRKGDYRLYATVASMCSDSKPPKEYQLMHDVLLREARKGSIEAQRNLAALCFDSPLGKREYHLLREIVQDGKRQQSQWNDRLEFLPESWRNPVISKLQSVGIIRADKAPALKIYREATRYARKAALQGDMIARYLWLRYGLKCLQGFSVAEWEDIFAYDRLLFESGYAPYLEYMDFRTLNYVVLRSYYSEKSWDIRKNDYGASRGRLTLLPYRLNNMVKMNEAEETRRRLETLELVGQTDDLLKNLIGGDARVVLFAASAEVQAYLLEKVRKWAEEGDLLAVCTLAEFYKKGIAHPVDPRRANALYELVLSKENAASMMYIPDRNTQSSIEADVPLKEVALLGRAELVLDYKEFPGRNEKEAYDQLLDFVSHNKCYYPYYFLGRFHELGVGRPVDREKALEFYEKAADKSEACRKAVKRLSACMEAVKSS